MIKRHHIRQFLAVVDIGNFTRAAHHIGLTQPSLSAGILELERQMGSPLFIREKRHIRLTQAGSRFLPVARQIEQGFRSAQDIAQHSNAQNKMIRLGILRTISSHVMGMILSQLTPDITLEVIDGRANELQNALKNGRIDAAITLKPEKFAHITPLWREGYAMAFHLTHPLSHHEFIAVTELASERMIARRSCEILPRTSQFFTRKGVRPPFAYKSADDDRVLAMIAAGLGISIVPDSHARDDILLVPLEDFRPERHIAMVYGDVYFSKFGDDCPIAAAYQQMADQISINSTA